ncbi:phage gp36-like protein [Humitalea rosea]|uniref:Phage gp36-like protein n=1 Tax=Humitalea rosea TaxID=990373 RepID=A0A2W7IM66_9PROT|nr:DUF1320 domain-containing protein [Humitalea rosea]PZW46851.1 phage gp36-like protein [Humitalea rosea]
MAYADIAEMVDRFGEEELVQLAPTADGAPDPLRLNRAMADASDLADGYLRSRYAMPLAFVPPLLVQIVCAIARYTLHLGGNRQATDQVKAERDAAIALLRDIAASRADLGLDAQTPGPAAADGVLSQPRIAGLSECDLDAYRGFR